MRAIQWLVAALLAAVAVAWWAHKPGHSGGNSVFDWLVSGSAPAQYPVILVKGDMVWPDGGSQYIPDRRTLSRGWGEWESTHVAGPKQKPVPIKLQIEWLSLVENQFYAGTFDLPSERMSQLFNTRLPEHPGSRKPTDFDSILVGMAPGGQVTVWLLAMGTEQVEVATFQAQPTDLPWSRVTANTQLSRQEYVRLTLNEELTPAARARLEREGIRPELFKAYRQPWRWRPWVTGDGVVSGMRVHTFSGERAWFSERHKPVLDRSRMPTPSWLQVHYRSGQGVPLMAEVTLDEEEALAAFAKLSRGDPERQLALQLDTAGNAMSVALRDENFVLPLHKAKVAVYAGR